MATQPAFTWSASGGAVGPSGAYTAPAAAGSQTVTAAGGGISGSASVTVTNGTSAVASPAAVTGNSTALSVTGPRGSGLTYSWSVASEPPGAADPGFSRQRLRLRFGHDRHLLQGRRSTCSRSPSATASRTASTR